MHPYAQNSPHQPKLIALIAIFSVALASLLGFISAQLTETTGITVGSISTLAIFSMLWWLFDKKLWKCELTRKLLLVPDLNGTWHCAGKTLRKNGESVEWDWNATIQIVQSWSKMRVVLKASQSGSTSIAASLYHEPGQGYRLIYHYDNDPNPDEADLARHTGLVNILFSEDIQSADGKYFTDKDRMTFGSMRLTRNGTPNEQT
ncbi:hypothetical protein COB72_05600 [bacterium]|nr:MAG: hypothetical protein COB72_05600 [bacterium]